MTLTLIIGILSTSVLAQAIILEEEERLCGGVYIKVDGSIEPPTAPIARDGSFYTFTDHISDGIVIEKDDIVVDGAGFTLQGMGVDNLVGVYLSGRSNIEIKNMVINAFDYGMVLEYSSDNIISGNKITNSSESILLEYSSKNEIFGNNITNSYSGIMLEYSSDNDISGNNIRDSGDGVQLWGACNQNNVSGNNIDNSGCGVVLFGSCHYNIVIGNQVTNGNYTGIELYDSSNNEILENNITNGGQGIVLENSLYNIISGNNITDNNYEGILMWYWAFNNSVYENSVKNNYYGIYLADSSNNSIYHNDFINNTEQVYDYMWEFPEEQPSVNVWDDGYPSGGNYWSSYTGVDEDDDGIGDTPFVIDLNNTDHYPLMASYVPQEDISLPTLSVLSVEVSADKNSIKPGKTSIITVRLMDAANPVEGADIIITCENGSFSLERGTTDSNGYFRCTYTAPSTITRTTLSSITVSATKEGYISGEGQTQITLEASGGIPGFPHESIILGLLSGILLLWIFNRKR